MTKDFRNVGRQPAPTQPAAAPPGIAPHQPPHQRVILIAIYASAVGFFLAGFWLLSGRPSPLPAEITPTIGLAFVISAVADMVAAVVMKRFWAKQAGR